MGSAFGCFAKCSVNHDSTKCGADEQFSCKVLEEITTEHAAVQPQASSIDESQAVSRISLQTPGTTASATASLEDVRPALVKTHSTPNPRVPRRAHFAVSKSQSCPQPGARSAPNHTRPRPPASGNVPRRSEASRTRACRHLRRRSRRPTKVRGPVGRTQHNSAGSGVGSRELNDTWMQLALTGMAHSTSMLATLLHQSYERRAGCVLPSAGSPGRLVLGSQSSLASDIRFSTHGSGSHAMSIDSLSKGRHSAAAADGSPLPRTSLKTSPASSVSNGDCLEGIERSLHQLRLQLLSQPQRGAGARAVTELQALEPSRGHGARLADPTPSGCHDKVATATQPAVQPAPAASDQPNESFQGHDSAPSKGRHAPLAPGVPCTAKKMAMFACHRATQRREDPGALSANDTPCYLTETEPAVYAANAVTAWDTAVASVAVMQHALELDCCYNSLEDLGTPVLKLPPMLLADGTVAPSSAASSFTGEYSRAAWLLAMERNSQWHRAGGATTLVEPEAADTAQPARPLAVRDCTGSDAQCNMALRSGGAGTCIANLHWLNNGTGALLGA